MSIKRRLIKAILFDMDGVLVDAKEWHYEALNKALGLFGMEISRYDHLVTYDGLPTQKKLEMLTVERGLPNSLHNFINDVKQKYTQEICFSNCKPNFNIQKTLNFLKKNNYRLAVCSNSVLQSVEIMLTRSNLISFFEFYLSNQDVKNPKPSPDIYRMALKKLNVTPDECLIVEDHPNGINAAKDSGAHVLEISSINEVNIDNIINKISELEVIND